MNKQYFLFANISYCFNGDMGGHFRYVKETGMPVKSTTLNHWRSAKKRSAGAFLSLASPRAVMMVVANTANSI